MRRTKVLTRSNSTVLLAMKSGIGGCWKMKTVIATAVAAILATGSAIGWLVEEPVDYSDQLKTADFVGIVEVSGIIETGRKKVLYEGGVAFRELGLNLKVLSAFKGKEETVVCSIYREPTREELLADGVSENEVFRILLNLGVDEALHSGPARVAKGDQLLVYLRSENAIHVPVTGDVNSSRSLLRLQPSNIVNTSPVGVPTD